MATTMPIHVHAPRASCAWRAPTKQHFAATHRRFSSERAAGRTAIQEYDDVDVGIRGEECYRLATEALRRSDRARRLREGRLLREQYDAMEGQRERTRQRERGRTRRRAEEDDPRLRKLRDRKGELDGSDATASFDGMGGKREGKKEEEIVVRDRAAGVAVVRTIVRQSQPPKNNGYNDSARIVTEDEEEDDEEHWQSAAREHLEEAAFRYGHGKALVRLGNEAHSELAKDGDDGPSADDSTTVKPSFNRERCMSWMDESPIDLAALLDIGAVESDSAEVNSEERSSRSQYHRQLALHLYELAGKRGSAEGWYNLGSLLWGGPDANSDIGAAMLAFHEAMVLGDADATYFVASQYLSYDECEDEDAALVLEETYNQLLGEKAFDSLLSESSSLPPLDEQLLSSLSKMQRHGYRLLHRAAHGHAHGKALHHLALLHIQHDGSNVDVFKSLLTKAADAGNPDSLFLRGHCRYSGSDGYERNHRAALDDFLEASEGDHVDAMVSAGAMLHRGVRSEGGALIVPVDRRRAFELYQRAGDLGSVEGWRNVVGCYARGEGVPRDLDMAKYIADTLLKKDD